MGGVVCVNRGEEWKTGPDGGMGVLPAVFTNARHITFDITGVERRAIERRREQKDEPFGPKDQLTIDGRHGPDGSPVLCGPTQHSPGLSNRVNPALGIRCRAKRRAVIEVGAAVPFAIPTFPLERRFQSANVEPPSLHAFVFAARICNLGKLPENRVQKPSEPDTFTLTVLADAIHAVIPSARSLQPDTFTAHCQAAIQCTRAMLKESCASAGHPRPKIRFGLSIR